MLDDVCTIYLLLINEKKISENNTDVQFTLDMRRDKREFEGTDKEFFLLHQLDEMGEYCEIIRKLQ